MLNLFRNLFAPPRDLILVVIAIWLGTLLSDKRAHRHGIRPSALEKLTFYPLMAFIIGGRLLYVVENIASFTQSPLDIFSLNLELFDLWGGLIVAVLTAFVIGYRANLPFWPVLDALTPVFAVTLVGVNLANFASGQAFGRETTLPWAIEMWGAARHPSQLYATLASLLTLGLLWFQKTDSPPGIHFLTFSALTSGWTLFLEAFRGDSTLIFGGLRSAQAIAWLVLALSLFLIDNIQSEPMDTRSGR
ncbi:MAG: hypothetical protein Kow002_07720 [Anaerolineales bacterium]